MEYKTYFLNRGYVGKHIDQEFSKAKKISREKALKKSAKRCTDRIPFIMKWDPRLPNVNAVIRKNLKFLYSEQENQKIFPKKSFMVSHKRSKNLKEILVPTKLPRIEETSSQKVTTMDVSNVQPKYVIYVRTTLNKQKDLQVLSPKTVIL